MLCHRNTMYFVTYVLPMTKQRLTDTTIRNLKPEVGSSTSVGMRTWAAWAYAFRRRGLNRSCSSTGSALAAPYDRRAVSGLSLKDARDVARAYRQLVFQGRDPAEEKKDQRRNVYAFDEFVRHFIETYGKPNNRTWKESERLLTRHFVKVWRKRDIRQIKKADVIAVLDGIVARGNGTSASRAFAQIRKLFNWAVEPATSKARRARD